MPTKSKRRLTLFLNPELIIQARAQAVIEHSTLSHLVEKALAGYLPEQTIIKKPAIK